MSGSEPRQMALESSQVVVILKFDMDIHTSTLTTKELKEAITGYCIPTDLHPRLPLPELTMDNLPPNVIGIYIEQLEQGGLRIHLSTFFPAVIKHFRVHVSQLVPMGVNRVIMFEVRCWSLDINDWKKKFFLIDQRAIPDAMPWRHINTDVRDDFPVNYKEGDADRNNQVKDNKIELLVQQYKQFVISEDESIDSAFARFNTIITSLKALDEVENLTSLSLDELIGNLKFHAMIIKKDSEIVKAKGERRSLALKAKKESSDEECSTSGSEDKEYAMAVRDFKKCGDPNHLIGECLKPPRDKNHRAFVGGSWSDSGEEDDEKVKDEACLVAQAPNEVCSESSYFSDENSSVDDLVLDNEYDKLCKISLKIITKNKRSKATRNSLEKELNELKEKFSTLEKNKGVDLECIKCQLLKIENEKLKEEAIRLTKFEKSTHCLNKMLSNQKPSGEKLGLGFNSFEASSSGTKEIKFMKAQKKASSDGGLINMGGPQNVQAAPKAITGQPPVSTLGSEKSVSFQKSILGPRPKHIIVRNIKVHVASDDVVKQFYKPLSKLGVGFSKPNVRSKTPPPRRINNNYPRSKTPQPKRNVGQQNQPHGFPICLGVNLEPDKWIKDSGCSKHMTGNRKLFSNYKAYNREHVDNLGFNLLSIGQICDNKCRVTFSEQDSEITKDGKVIESLNVTFDETPPPSKTSPLVDGDLDEEEAIKVTKKKNLENDIEDETLGIDEIVNIKESRNHPLEHVNIKWVFRNELDENGVVSRNKARLVAQGYNQQEGINYDETYAPVARLKSIRILLAYAYALDFKLFQMDVKSAFLNGFINEEVYVAQPPGFIDFEKPDHVYKLKKALYGLKQAPKAWYDRLKAFLIKHEYKMGIIDNTLFTKKKSLNLIIVQIYVDDIIFGSTCQDMCDEFAKIMHDEFEMSMMGKLNFFLGLQIKQMEDGIFFNQSKYIKEMLKKFGLEDSKPMKTPHKQTSLAISTTEAKYVSAEKACQQALWMKQALIDYEVEFFEGWKPLSPLQLAVEEVMSE
ncbi:copia protein [Tanacetum coccineum]